MNESELTLIEPIGKMKTGFIEMAQEFCEVGDDRFKTAINNFPAYLEQAHNHSQNINLPLNRVQETTFWLTDQRRLFGQSKIRHRLTPELEYEGGHIGYQIRPSERYKGYGTLILKLTLEKARNLGLSKVLLTCDTDNIGSSKIILNNGGKFRQELSSKISGKQISQYWIEI